MPGGVVMALPMKLVVGMLMLSGVQASDIADGSKNHGFLSEYMPIRSGFSKSSIGHNGKFVAHHLKHMDHGGRPAAPSDHNDPAEEAPTMPTVDSPFIVYRDKPAHFFAPTQGTKEVRPAKAGAFRTNKDLKSQKIANKDEDKDVQQLLTTASNKPMGLSAIGVALFSFAAMLGVRLRRGMQPAIGLASSGMHGIDMSIPLVPVSVDNTLDLESQGSCLEISEQVLQGSERATAKDMHADMKNPFALRDPFGLGETASEAHVENIRESELQHGRAAIAAIFFVSPQMPRPMHTLMLAHEREKRIKNACAKQCHIAVVLFRKTDLRSTDHEAIAGAVQELQQRSRAASPPKGRKAKDEAKSLFLLPLYLMADDLGVDAAVHGHPQGLRARCQEGLYWRGITQLADSLQKISPEWNLVRAAFPVRKGQQLRQPTRQPNKRDDQRFTGSDPLQNLLPAYGRAFAAALDTILGYLENPSEDSDPAGNGQSAPLCGTFSIHMGKSFVPTAAEADSAMLAALRKLRSNTGGASSSSTGAGNINANRHGSNRQLCLSGVHQYNTSLIFDVAELPTSLDSDKYWRGHWGTLMQFLNCCENNECSLKNAAAGVPSTQLKDQVVGNGNGGTIIPLPLGNVRSCDVEILAGSSGGLALTDVDAVFERQFLAESVSGSSYRVDLGFHNETGHSQKPKSSSSSNAPGRHWAEWIDRVYGPDFAENKGRFVAASDQSSSSSSSRQQVRLAASTSSGGGKVSASAFFDLTTASDFSESEARRLLAKYLDPQSGGIQIYEKKRSRIDLPTASSRLSVFLVFGLLSPKRLQREIVRLRDLNKMDRADLKTFGRRLVWRDLAYWQLNMFPDSHTVGIREHYDTTEWRGPLAAPMNENAKTAGAWKDVTTTTSSTAKSSSSETYIQRWRYGYTGYPLVDAGMRQLWRQGWIQQNVRMVTASFLVEYLRLDWKHGHRWYLETLLDHDVAINAMMWQNAGRSGIDQWNFVLSPLQGASRDPSGGYCLRWCPELAGILGTTTSGSKGDGGGGGKSNKGKGKKGSAGKQIDRLFNPSGHAGEAGVLDAVKLVSLSGDRPDSYRISRGGDLVPVSASRGRGGSASSNTNVNVYPYACVPPSDLNNEQSRAKADVVKMRRQFPQFNNHNGYDIVEARGKKGTYKTHIFTKIPFRVTTATGGKASSAKKRRPSRSSKSQKVGGPGNIPRPRGRAPGGADWDYEKGVWVGGMPPKSKVSKSAAKPAAKKPATKKPASRGKWKTISRHSQSK